MVDTPARPRPLEIPMGEIRHYVGKIVALVHSVASWARVVNLVPHARHASGRYLPLQSLPYSQSDLGLTPVSVPSVTGSSSSSSGSRASGDGGDTLEEEEARARDVFLFEASRARQLTEPLGADLTDLDREIQEKNSVIGFYPVQRLGGRKQCQLYLGNKPVKEKDLTVRYELDAWLTKVLRFYPDLVEGVARGDVWTIWSNMVKRGQPRDEDIQARVNLFLLKYIFPTENAAQFLQRVSAELLLLRGWGQRIASTVVERVKVEGLRYTLEVKAGYDLSDYELVRSHYHKLMGELDRISVSSMSRLTLEDYLVEIAKHEEEVGMRKARTKAGKKVTPEVGLRAEVSAKRYCFDFQGPEGSCKRESCSFIHEKNEAALEWLLRRKAGGAEKTTPGLFHECKAQGVCFKFNTTKGCEKPVCHFEHKKVSSTPAASSGKKQKCKKCKTFHKPSEGCVSSSHQTGVQSDQDESSQDENDDDDDDDELEQVATGGMAAALNNITYGQVRKLRRGLADKVATPTVSRRFKKKD
jgi:hypothetical protein